ncbi:hypothetical protein ACFSYH_10465 [Populibacterium corticicola]|uniref:SMODS-associating 2TM beta-strand rich effector domain-containing protein n=1 Tax=Populibacterium corticicola TaxID=1812826 RepID=A0ABW5XG94_9MICO
MPEALESLTSFLALAVSITSLWVSTVMWTRQRKKVVWYATKDLLVSDVAPQTAVPYALNLLNVGEGTAYAVSMTTTGEVKAGFLDHHEGHVKNAQPEHGVKGRVEPDENIIVAYWWADQSFSSSPSFAGDGTITICWSQSPALRERHYQQTFTFKHAKVSSGEILRRSKHKRKADLRSSSIN